MIRTSLSALALTAAFCALADAQQTVQGVYDATSIPGWEYNPDSSAELGLPTWVQAGVDPENRVANCNITVSEVTATRADYDQYFQAVTPQRFARQMAESGTVVTHAYLTAVFEMDGRPVMRNLLTTDHEGTTVDLVSVIIGGADHMVTISCGLPGGMLIGHLQPFQDFLEGVRITTQRPQ